MKARRKSSCPLCGGASYTLDDSGPCVPVRQYAVCRCPKCGHEIETYSEVVGAWCVPCDVVMETVYESERKRVSD